MTETKDQTYWVEGQRFESAYFSKGMNWWYQGGRIRFDVETYGIRNHSQSASMTVDQFEDLIIKGRLIPAKKDSE